MFEGLLKLDPEPLANDEGVLAIERVEPAAIINAQATTADWLTTLGADDDEAVGQEAAASRAREAFMAVTTTTPSDAQRGALMTLKTPEAVRHLTGMLTAYDWEFVEEAKRIRGFVVAKLLEEANGSNASIRMKALQTLGKVTEVGLFTEKVEITKKDLSDAEIDQRIKDKLAKFMGVIDAIDVSSRPVEDGDEAV
jgi:hypothetical protein